MSIVPEGERYEEMNENKGVASTLLTKRKEGRKEDKGGGDQEEVKKKIKFFEVAPCVCWLSQVGWRLEERNPISIIARNCKMIESFGVKA